jgi:hypothetical protein
MATIQATNWNGIVLYKFKERGRKGTDGGPALEHQTLHGHSLCKILCGLRLASSCTEGNANLPTSVLHFSDVLEPRDAALWRIYELDKTLKGTSPD